MRRSIVYMIFSNQRKILSPMMCIDVSDKKFKSNTPLNKLKFIKLFSSIAGPNINNLSLDLFKMNRNQTEPLHSSATRRQCSCH